MTMAGKSTKFFIGDTSSIVSFGGYLSEKNIQPNLSFLEQSKSEEVSSCDEGFFGRMFQAMIWCRVDGTVDGSEIGEKTTWDV